MRIYELPGGRRIVADADFVAREHPGASLVEEVAPPTPVPAEVTMRQARELLITEGMIDAVEAAIDAIPNPLARRKARNTWEHSQVVQRNNGLVAAMAPSLGLTNAQLDDFFIRASSL